MVKVRFQKIIWSDYVKDHIKKHEFSVEGVEEIIKSDVLVNEGHSGRKILTNRIGTRLLSVVVVMKVNRIYVVTARDANDKERQGYYELKKNKKD